LLKVWAQTVFYANKGVISVAAKVIEQPAAALTWPQALAWRMARQYLTRRLPPDRLMEVVSNLGGLHAQLTSCAELTLWARVEGLLPGRVSELLWQERQLVKTWAMRGTLHLLPSAEYWDYQAVFAANDNYLKPAWLRYFGFTLDEIKQVIAGVGQALDGQVLTRQELAGAVGRVTGSPALGEKLNDSWGSVLKPASYQGQLCFGSSQGQNVRFARPDRWLKMPRPATVEKVKPFLDMARRFLAANAPATTEDYARWRGITPAQAKTQLKDMGEETCQVELDGERYWLLAKDLPQVQATEPPGIARLIPAFDQYIIGATLQVDKLTPGPFKKRIYRPQGWISAVLLVDGRMEGTWKYEQKGKRLLVKIAPFREQPGWVKPQVEAEAARLAAYLDGELELVWN
jgi:hypothetical protein